jgi:hypothetical protein
MRFRACFRKISHVQAPKKRKIKEKTSQKSAASHAKSF